MFGRSGWRVGLLGVIALAVLVVGCFRVYRHFFPVIPPTAAQEVQDATAAAKTVTSASAHFSTQVSGLTVMYGSVSERVTRTTRLATLSMTSVDGADRFAVAEVVTPSNVYVSMPSLTAADGKPWLAVPLGQLDSDPAMAQLYQTGALPTVEAALLGTASTARLAGTATVRGVPVSRYVGSIDPATALTALTPEMHQLLAPELSATTGTIRFTAWIDARHNLREVETSAIVGGRLTVTTVVVTAFNRPVHIAVPQASDVAALAAA